MKHHFQFDGNTDANLMIAKILVAAVALLHTAFMYMECVLWNKPAGRRINAISDTQARQTAAPAANQVLYCGFLAIGATRRDSIIAGIALLRLAVTANGPSDPASAQTRRLVLHS
jgi:uncharacterized membrane protein